MLGHKTLKVLGLTSLILIKDGSIALTVSDAPNWFDWSVRLNEQMTSSSLTASQEVEEQA